MNLCHRLTAWLRDIWLDLDLVLSWHIDRADQLREDQEPFYRPLYRLAESTEKHLARVTGLQVNHLEYVGSLIRPIAAHCVNCGHRGSVLVPDGAEPADVENEILDMLECPVCGLYTMCSD